jgi:hypothetical protein
VGSPSPAVPNTACPPSRLHATFTYLPGSNGAGQVYYELTVINRSGAACPAKITGFQLLGAGGQLRPSNVQTTGSAEIRLAAGQWAQAQGKFSPDVSGPGENGNACEPVSESLRLIVDGGVVTAPMDPTRVCEHGSIYLSRLAAVPVTPACGPASLQGTFIKAGHDSALGYLDYELRLRNTSSSACFVDTYPGLRLLGAHGQALTTRVVAGVDSPLVVRPGARWEADATFSATGGTCDASATHIRITPSPGVGALTAVVSGPVVACHHGRLQLSGLFQSG